MSKVPQITGGMRTTSATKTSSFPAMHSYQKKVEKETAERFGLMFAKVYSNERVLMFARSTILTHLLYFLYYFQFSQCTVASDESDVP